MRPPWRTKREFTMADDTSDDWLVQRKRKRMIMAGIAVIGGAGIAAGLMMFVLDAEGELLDEVGLGARADDPAGTLTLAGRKRLEIARALATRPRLLLLDEVMAGLTPVEVAEALEIIRRLHQRYDLTIVVIEHVMRALMRLSERLVVLHHGAKIAEGRPDEIANDAGVIEAYLGGGAR